ncbi:MAG: hypothetical protein U0R51_01730 [Solirubrobacterales bacterium]
MGWRLTGLLATASLLALLALPAAAHASGDTVDAIADGGFENSTCHDVDTVYGSVPYCEDPAWTTGEIQASICGKPECAPLAAHGNGFLNLGGAYMDSGNSMTGAVSQNVDLPPGPKTLTFAIQVSYENPLTFAAASVEVDGTPVYGKSSGQASPYGTESVDMSGYSGVHEISFRADCSYSVAMPAARTCDGFRVDDISLPVAWPAPEVEFTGGPPPETGRHRARIAFAAGGSGGAGFRCRLDHDAWSECASPLRLRAGPGPHRLRVRSVSLTGELSPTAVWSWRAD